MPTPLPEEIFNNPVDDKNEHGYWDTQSVHELLLESNPDQTIRSTERTLEASGLLPATLKLPDLLDETGRTSRQQVVANIEGEAKRKRWTSLILQVHESENGKLVLFGNDARLGRRWVFIDSVEDAESLLQALEVLADGRNMVVWPHGAITPHLSAIVRENRSHDFTLASGKILRIGSFAYSEKGEGVFSSRAAHLQSQGGSLTHLDRLEADSMHIIREVMAQAENPVMLYSVGKDSSVMLHLAKKAFYPSPPPFPLMHVDTRWKFQAMYQFRDEMAKDVGMDLIVHINPDGVEKNINPFDHGSALHTDIMKTEGLKQALDKYQFDVAFGGARRDEEKSRAKERVFSFRTSTHRWDPKNQRPELWNLYNGYKTRGESIRVFPLSNWTELDIWQYIYREQIPIVPLYYAAERPVVERDGMLMLVDDDRLKLFDDEKVQIKRVRFRTLGCYPLTGAIESDADDLSSIVLELLQSRTSERQGRAIDSDSSGSMEKKKQEGYF